MKGRGALSNPPGRYEPRRLEADPEGRAPDDPEVPRRTEILEDATRTVISENDSPDVPFDLSINPYRGCEHGCVYCFARPSHAWLGLSPGLDFETKIVAKPKAAELLRRELSRPDYRCSPIALGSNTDPYQPVERRLRITRSILEVLAERCHPFTIVTKSALVLRDLDVIAPMAERRMARVYVSVTTLDPAIASTLEPRAASPERRLSTIAGLTDAGVPTGVLASPLIPGLTDHELERILEAAAERGASQAGYLLVRLPHEVKDLFLEWLREHAPTRAGKVESLLRALRGGRLNDPRFGSRMKGHGPFADLLHRRFEVACRRLGLEHRSHDLDTSRFRGARGQRALF